MQGKTYNNEFYWMGAIAKNFSKVEVKAKKSRLWLKSLA